jgi:hypothetical protein
LANPLRKEAREHYGKYTNDWPCDAAEKAKVSRSIGVNHANIAHATPGAFAIPVVKKPGLIRDVGQRRQECYLQHGKANIGGNGNCDHPNEE